MKERRRFPRYESSLEVKYSTKGSASIEGYTVSKNISRVGICMPVSRIVNVGDMLNLKIDPNDKKGPVDALGKVVWAKNIARPSHLELDAGLEFTRLDSADAERLLQGAY